MIINSINSIEANQNTSLCLLTSLSEMSNIPVNELKQGIPDEVIAKVEAHSDLVINVGSDLFDLKRREHPIFTPIDIYPDQKADDLLQSRALLKTLYFALDFNDFKEGCNEYNDPTSDFAKELNISIMGDFLFEDSAAWVFRRVYKQEGDSAAAYEETTPTIKVELLDLYEMLLSLEKTKDWIRYNKEFNWRGVPLSLEEKNLLHFRKHYGKGGEHLTRWERGGLDYQLQSSINGFPIDLNIIDMHFDALKILDTSPKYAGEKTYVFSNFLINLLNTYGFEKLESLQKNKKSKKYSRTLLSREASVKKSNRLDLNNHILFYHTSRFLQLLSLDS